jgi:transposase
VRPKAIPGRSPKKRAQVEAGVLPQLQAYSDETLEQHCFMWEKTHGERVSRWTMSRAIKRLGWTRKKKTVKASEQNEAARSAWREQAAKLPSEDLVVVDETGSQINMTPLYAYAPRGERAVGRVPRNYGANMTVIASLSLSGMGETMLLDGSADAAAFETYIEQILAPSLRPGQIVILDNLSIHLGFRVKEAIEGRSCQLLYLPAYSPDFSPIEGAFSKLKTILRRIGARTHEALQEAIIEALPRITAQDALGWFLYCGYPAPSTGNTAQSLSTPL